MTITLAIIGALACVIGLGVIKAKESWDENTKPPRGGCNIRGIEQKYQKDHHNFYFITYNGLAI